MDNKILEALSQVPKLVDATETANKINQEQSQRLAEIAQRNVHAVFPDREVDKVTKAVEDTVKATPCALPDTDELASQVAEGILTRVKDTIEDAVEEKIRATPVKLEHHHTHATTYEMARLASDWTRKWLITLLILCFTLVLVIVGGAYWYYSSENYWGREYAKLHNSKYSTQEEKEMLWHNAYTVSVLPTEFNTNPQYVKAKIRQNRQVLNERRRQAETNKGKYSIGVSLER